MTIETMEMLRRVRLVELNIQAADRLALERRHGRVWDPGELRQEFVVIGYMARYVVVRRKANGVDGSLEFQHEPRFYFNWREDRFGSADDEMIRAGGRRPKGDTSETTD
jgi:hypothetical protein